MKVRATITNRENASFYIEFEADNFEAAAAKAGDYYDTGIGSLPVGNRGETVRVAISDGTTTQYFKVIGWMSPRYSANECEPFEVSEAISLKKLFEGF